MDEDLVEVNQSPDGQGRVSPAPFSALASQPHTHGKGEVRPRARSVAESKARM